MKGEQFPLVFLSEDPSKKLIQNTSILIHNKSVFKSDLFETYCYTQTQHTLIPDVNRNKEQKGHSSSSVSPQCYFSGKKDCLEGISSTESCVKIRFEL